MITSILIEQDEPKSKEVFEAEELFRQQKIRSSARLSINPPELEKIITAFEALCEERTVVEDSADLCADYLLCRMAENSALSAWSWIHAIISIAYQIGRNTAKAEKGLNHE